MGSNWLALSTAKLDCWSSSKWVRHEEELIRAGFIEKDDLFIDPKLEIFENFTVHFDQDTINHAISVMTNPAELEKTGVTGNWGILM